LSQKCKFFALKFFLNWWHQLNWFQIAREKRELCHRMYQLMYFVSHYIIPFVDRLLSTVKCFHNFCKTRGWNWLSVTMYLILNLSICDILYLSILLHSILYTSMLPSKCNIYFYFSLICSFTQHVLALISHHQVYFTLLKTFYSFISYPWIIIHDIGQVITSRRLQ
jgi:hypothetical protein